MLIGDWARPEAHRDVARAGVATKTSRHKQKKETILAVDAAEKNDFCKLIAATESCLFVVMRVVTSLPLLLVLSTVVCATKRAPVLLKAPPLACSWSTQPLAHLRPEPPPTTVVRLELLLTTSIYLL